VTFCTFRTFRFLIFVTELLSTLHCECKLGSSVKEIHCNFTVYVLNPSLIYMRVIYMICIHSTASEYGQSKVIIGPCV
jgi:hypothetical protein